MLEHFEKEAGVKLLQNCLSNAEYVMINIPLGNNWKQDEMYGNKYEKHRSVWKIQDLRKGNVLKKRIFRDFLNRQFLTILPALGDAPSQLTFVHHLHPDPRQ